MRRSAAVLIALVALASVERTIVRAADIPFLTGRVVDDAGILSADARAKLAGTLKAHEDATGNQIVVLTVPTIQPQSVEDYAVKVFASWKLGQKEKDNGVLVLVVPQDRKMRIEVGYGLEPTLTDGTCGEIIRTFMTPAFKEGNYDKGVEAGVGAIVARLEGHELPPAPASSRTVSSRGFDPPDMPWPQRILLGVFVFSIIGLFTFLGIATPGVGWFLYVFLIPFWAIFPMFIIGPKSTLGVLGMYLIGYPLAKLRLRNTAWYRKAAQDLKTKGHATIGGFTFSSGGSSSSSGGGFSGGGGGSGGGGASGSW